MWDFPVHMRETSMHVSVNQECMDPGLCWAWQRTVFLELTVDGRGVLHGTLHIWELSQQDCCVC